MRCFAICCGLMVLASLTAVFAAPAQFSATVEIRRPPGLGVVTATIRYNEAAEGYRLDYTDRTYYEIFKYNPLYGSDQRYDYDNWVYQVGQFCNGQCRAGRVDHAFPRLQYNVSYWITTSGGPITVDSQTCQPFRPVSNYSPGITTAWFSGTRVCRVAWTDGATWTFLGVTNVAVNATSVFSEPPDCQCGDKLDVIILIDRSASISRKAYDDGRAFARDFTLRFTLSPAQVHVAIAHFDTDVELIMDLYEGTSQANVDAAINAMSCSCNTAVLDNSGQDEAPDRNVCCKRRTSIGKALDRASQYFAANGRPGSWRAVLVVSDGKSSTTANGTNCRTGSECDSDVTAAVTRIVAHNPGLSLLGVGMGNSNHDKMALCTGGRYSHVTNTSYYWAERNFYLQGAVGCSLPVYYCNSSTCGGLCECGECMKPTTCEPSTDFCVINTVDHLTRSCVARPRDCSLEPMIPTCTVSSCNSTLGACVNAPVVCPQSTNICYNNTCDAVQDHCVQRCFSENNCNDGSLSNCGQVAGCDDVTDCEDNDPVRISDSVSCFSSWQCTTQSCTGGLCSWQQISCNDDDICTTDFCDSVLGCRHIQAPAEQCDDGVSCTIDACVNNECVSTAIQCNDGLGCTVDTCNETLGHCLYEPILCPISNDNCTLNYCMFGGCTRRTLCPTELLTADNSLSAGGVAGVAIAAILGTTALAAACYVIWRIKQAPKVEKQGGSAEDFAAD